MIEPDETFDGTWPYRHRFFEGNGFRMHYVDDAGERSNINTALEALDDDVDLIGRPVGVQFIGNRLDAETQLGQTVATDRTHDPDSETVRRARSPSNGEPGLATTSAAIASSTATSTKGTRGFTIFAASWSSRRTLFARCGATMHCPPPPRSESNDPSRERRPPNGGCPPVRRRFGPPDPVLEVVWRADSLEREDRRERPVAIFSPGST